MIKFVVAKVARPKSDSCFFSADPKSIEESDTFEDLEKARKLMISKNSHNMDRAVEFRIKEYKYTSEDGYVFPYASKLLEI